MKTLFLMLVIGSCLLAQAADPNSTETADPTAKPIIVASVKEAAKLPATDDTFNITVFDADPTAKKLNINTATVEAVKTFTENKPLNLVIATVDAAKSSPFKGKIVRVQAASGNRSEMFTLENVKLTSLLGNEFITGTAVKYDNDLFSGLEVYINLRDVLIIVAMTPDQAKKFNEARPHQPQQRANPPQPSYPSPMPPPGWNSPPQYNPPGGQGYPQPGFNPQPPGQGPYTPPQGNNPQPWNNPPPGWWNPQPQGPYMPGNNPQQGSPTGPGGRPQE